MTTPQPILPGATLGVMGGGQLGRMFAQAAQQLGYRVHVLTPEEGSPAGQVAEQTYVGDFQDADAVAAFAQSVEVITFEFENVPAQAADTAARHALVRPSGSVLATAQNRLREKSTLHDAGLPVTPFEPVHSLSDLDQALERLGAPAILKTANSGYDGKGQVRIDQADAAEAAWDALSDDELILEKAITFDCELSVVAARSVSGDVACYGPIENEHSHHILDVSVWPARVPDHVARDAKEITRQIMETLDVIGVLCVEFFLANDNTLLINEIAPRPHNSGHLTIDACVCSQFDQQVRTICGLPLGSTAFHRPAAMANLLGDLWSAGTPDWEQALRIPDVKVHLYGKQDARPGRKMGHLTALAADANEAAERVRRARQVLCEDASRPVRP